MQFIVAKENFFFWHYLLFINVSRQSHIYMSKDFDDYNLIFHLPFSVGYLLCTTLISPCYYLIKRNKNYNGTHNVNSAHCNFIIELFMTLCKKNYWLWIMFIFLDFAHKTNIWGQNQVYKSYLLYFDLSNSGFLSYRYTPGIFKIWTKRAIGHYLPLQITYCLIIYMYRYCGQRI